MIIVGLENQWQDADTEVSALRTGQKIDTYTHSEEHGFHRSKGLVKVMNAASDLVRVTTVSGISADLGQSTNVLVWTGPPCPAGRCDANIVAVMHPNGQLQWEAVAEIINLYQIPAIGLSCAKSVTIGRDRHAGYIVVTP